MNLFALMQMSFRRIMIIKIAYTVERTRTLLARRTRYLLGACQPLNCFHREKRKKRNISREVSSTQLTIGWTHFVLCFSMDARIKRTFPCDIINSPKKRNKKLLSTFFSKASKIATRNHQHRLIGFERGIRREILCYHIKNSSTPQNSSYTFSSDMT